MNLLKKRGFTLIELMIVVAIIGILAAIAIPNFIKFQARSKQAEARTNLKSVFTAQKSYFGDHDKFGTTFKNIGFAPEPGNRYSYGMRTGGDCVALSSTLAEDCLGQDLKFGSTLPTSHPPLAAGGVLPTLASCPGACYFNASAQGNVDNDPDADSWGITSSVGTAIALTNACGVEGVNAPPGEPTNAYNDVSCP